MSAIASDAVADTTPDFLNDALAGLRRQPKLIAPKYFYDQTGSELFDRICELPEYYPTRTELGILQNHASAMAEVIGANALLIEPGCGGCTKVRYLLDALSQPAGFVPVEISGEHMLQNLAPLRTAYPNLPLHPLCADFTQPFQLPTDCDQNARRVLFFPGSTIGNFMPSEAERLLRGMHDLVGADGMLLLGIDQVKQTLVLEQAYNDRTGITAAFNRNLLRRMNTELGADFQLDGFRHKALWNAQERRIEMHLVSKQRQRVRIDGHAIDFQPGESLITEYSYKYTDERLDALAAASGFRVRRRWSDARDWFAVYLLDAE